MSRYRFADGAGTTWDVGYDAPTASFYAEASTLYSFDVSNRVLGPSATERWHVQWEPDERQIVAEWVEPSAYAADRADSFRSVDELARATAGQVPAAVRQALARDIAGPPRVVGDDGELPTFAHLERALSGHGVRVPADVRTKLLADEPRDVRTAQASAIARADQVQAAFDERAAAALQAARAGTTPRTTFTPAADPVRRQPAPTAAPARDAGNDLQR